MSDSSRNGTPPPKGSGTAWTGETTLRDFVQLAAGEKVELSVSAGPWAMIRKLGPDEPPQATGMVFAGSLAKLAVPEVISLVHSTGLEGELTFGFPDATKRVFFRGGTIVFATSTMVDDRLGEMLLAHGRIDRKTFEDATHTCLRDRKKLGRVLVERKILSARELYEAVVEQVESIVLSVFTYQEGHFAFVARPVTIANPVSLTHTISHLILEGVRLNDELRGSLEQVSDRLSVFKASGKGALVVADGRPGVERDVAALLDGVSPVWEILARSSWSEANTLLALARLVRAGLVEAVKPDPAVGGARAEKLDAASIGALVERVNGFLRSVQRAIAVVGGDPRALDGFFDGVKPSLRGLFAGVRLAQDGTLDGERLSRNVASVTATSADAMRLLREGLQEIVQFAFWIASDQVPEAEAARLAEEARTLREGSHE